jgi:hypothetical protein
MLIGHLSLRRSKLLLGYLILNKVILIQNTLLSLWTSLRMMPARLCQVGMLTEDNYKEAIIVALIIQE